MASDAVNDALQCYGKIRRIAVVTPYMPVADDQVRRYFEDCGYEVVALEGLKCASPVQIAHTSQRELRDAILKVNGPDVEAIVQVGTNLAAARLAAMAEFWLDKPVLATNTEGKGVVAIKIGDDAYVKTWNNSFSDLAHNTLVDTDSAVFRKLSSIKEGDRIKFSDRFFTSKVDCIREASLTLRGSLREPEFIVRFTKINTP
jgi:hypothetical protein